MKRLLAAGYPRIFQICKCFRKQERGARHLSEFTVLEWYCAESNYLDLMNQCEDLLQFIARTEGFGNYILYQGTRVDLNNPWSRMTVSEAFEKFASMPMEKALAEDRFDEILSFEIEPHLGHAKPLFLYDYPASRGALAKLHPDNNACAQRFELYICGLELCNAFTELTDPVEQKARFEKEREHRRLAGQQVYPMPDKFLESLKY
ncbi:MAG: EF-P lysine aminoacylase GenX, partial [Deltaproteobacteria bacterium CG1_02_45_11]